MKPFGVERWLKKLALAPKTKGHLQNLLRVLFNCAMRWELVDYGANPMKLVRVRGGSKRTKGPKVLTIQQFQQLVRALNDPYRTMVILDLATGLRCSELFALKWCDVIWDDLTLLVRRGIVDTVVSDVKTEYSRAGMPLDQRSPKCCCNGSARRSSVNPTTGSSQALSRQARCRGSLGECNSGISRPQQYAAA
jgi:integrase